jgi:hypothetical protein
MEQEFKGNAAMGSLMHTEPDFNEPSLSKAAESPKGGGAKTPRAASRAGSPVPAVQDDLLHRNGPSVVPLANV